MSQTLGSQDSYEEGELHFSQDRYESSFIDDESQTEEDSDGDYVPCEIDMWIEENRRDIDRVFKDLKTSMKKHFQTKSNEMNEPYMFQALSEFLHEFA